MSARAAAAVALRLAPAGVGCYITRVHPAPAAAGRGGVRRAGWLCALAGGSAEGWRRGRQLGRCSPKAYPRGARSFRVCRATPRFSPQRARGSAALPRCIICRRGAGCRGGRRAGRRGGPERRPRLGAKATGSCVTPGSRSLPARTNPPRPPLFSGGAGGCCRQSSGINGSGLSPVPAPCGAALASALFVTFVAVFQALRDRSHNSSWKCCIM